MIRSTAASFCRTACSASARWRSDRSKASTGGCPPTAPDCPACRTSHRRPSGSCISFRVEAPSQFELFEWKPLLRERMGEELPPSIRQGQRVTRDDGRAAVIPARHGALRLRPVRRERCLAQRTAAAPPEDRRRYLHHQVDAHRGDQPRSRGDLLSDGLADLRPAEHGQLAELRTGQRERRPSGLLRAAVPQCALRPTAVCEVVGQRIPAVRAPGRSFPVGRRPGPLPQQSRRQCRLPTAVACSTT